MPVKLPGRACRRLKKTGCLSRADHCGLAVRLRSTGQVKPGRPFSLSSWMMDGP